VVRELLREGGKALCLVFRHYPLIEVHPHAELAAEAAEAAAAQGRFWPMHERLWMAPHTLDAQALMAHAAAIGLDMVRFQADMADHLYTQRVQEHRRAGDASGVRATPAFFVNGKPVDVSFGPDHLVAAVRAALARAT
jgi:protein-disulfide isomerase